MKIDSETRLFALLGNPVSNSHSPMIHNTTFEDLGINARYMAFEIEKDDIENAVISMRTLDAKGFNVTIPFKETVIGHLDGLDKSAMEMKAVNTVSNENGRLIGYNTDGRGLLTALKENGVCVEGAKILIIGAGGAARGIGFAIANENIESIDIMNRSQGRAVKLVEDLVKIHPNKDFSYVGSEPAAPEKYDIVINATSIGMQPNVSGSPVDPSVFGKDCAFCDIVYKPHMTKLLSDASSIGRKVVFGIDMLIYQALLSEEIWNGVDIEKKVIAEKIKSQLGLG